MINFDEEKFVSASNRINNCTEDISNIKSSFNNINSLCSELGLNCDLSSIESGITGITDRMSVLSEKLDVLNLIIAFFNDYNLDFDDMGDFAAFEEFENMDYTGFYGAYQALPAVFFDAYLGDTSQLKDWQKSYLKNKTRLSGWQTEHVEIYKEMFSRLGITDERQISFVLKGLKAKGCGYCAVANVVVDLYKDHPNDFEKKYGFPLYSYDRDNNRQVVNYDLIIVDCFLAINEDKIKESMDKNGNIISSVLQGKNLSVKFSDMSKTLATYLGTDKSVTSSKHTNDISVSTYKNEMERNGYDYAMIAVTDFDLIPYGNNDQKDVNHVDVGHWMTIIGVSENGNYIVSSWGREWELVGGDPHNLDPDKNDDGGLIFFKVGDNK